jgi:hypothetical protein
VTKRGQRHTYSVDITEIAKGFVDAGLRCGGAVITGLVWRERVDIVARIDRDAAFATKVWAYVAAELHTQTLGGQRQDFEHVVTHVERMFAEQPS